MNFPKKERNELRLKLLTGHETGLTRRQALMLLDDLDEVDTDSAKLWEVADAACAVASAMPPVSGMHELDSALGRLDLALAALEKP